MLSAIRLLAVCFCIVAAAAASNITVTEILAETPSCAVGSPFLKYCWLLTMVAWVLCFGSGFGPDDTNGFYISVCEHNFAIFSLGMLASRV